MNHRHPCSRAASAFSLLELLVVVTIITILIAILMPHLSRARDAAQLAACAGRHAQLGKTNGELLADRFNIFSPMGQFMRKHRDTGVMTDPADPDALNLRLRNRHWGFDAWMDLSVAMNGELTAFDMSLMHVKNPDSKVLFYDGLSGIDADDPDRKITFTHRPPSNPTKRKTRAFSLSAAANHLSHGDSIGPAPVQSWEVAEYNRVMFNPRHRAGDGTGSVLFVDGHVEAWRELEPRVFNHFALADSVPAVGSAE